MCNAMTKMSAVSFLLEFTLRTAKKDIASNATTIDYTLCGKFRFAR